MSGELPVDSKSPAPPTLSDQLQEPANTVAVLRDLQTSVAALQELHDSFKDMMTSEWLQTQMARSFRSIVNDELKYIVTHAVRQAMKEYPRAVNLKAVPAELLKITIDDIKIDEYDPKKPIQTFNWPSADAFKLEWPDEVKERYRVCYDQAQSFEKSLKFAEDICRELHGSGGTLDTLVAEDQEHLILTASNHLTGRNLKSGRGLREHYLRGARGGKSKGCAVEMMMILGQWGLHDRLGHLPAWGLEKRGSAGPKRKASAAFEREGGENSGLGEKGAEVRGGEPAGSTAEGGQGAAPIVKEEAQMAAPASKEVEAQPAHATGEEGKEEAARSTREHEDSDKESGMFVPEEESEPMDVDVSQSF